MKILFDQDEKDLLMDIELNGDDLEDLLWGRLIEKKIKISGKPIVVSLYKREASHSED